MAEGLSSNTIGDVSKNTSSSSEKNDKSDMLECAVCLQPCEFPAQLPCGHIFCFLCIKGIANQSKRCAMCRHEIPRDFLEHPNLLKQPSNDTPVEDGKYQWFYEGRNGWWQYDERTSKELESCYKAGERTCELLIAGFLYVTDLEAMIQLRRTDPSRRRRIKRDLATIPKKGIAGLRIESSQTEDCVESVSTTPPDNRRQHHHRSTNLAEGRTDSLTPVTPSNTPQSPASGSESPSQIDLETTIGQIQALTLNANDNYDVDNISYATAFHRRHPQQPGPRHSHNHSNNNH